MRCEAACDAAAADEQREEVATLSAQLVELRSRLAASRDGSADARERVAAPTSEERAVGGAIAKLKAELAEEDAERARLQRKLVELQEKAARASALEGGGRGAPRAPSRARRHGRALARGRACAEPRARARRAARQPRATRRAGACGRGHAGAHRERARRARAAAAARQATRGRTRR